MAKLEGVSGGEAADGGYGKPRLDLGLVHPRVGLCRVWNLQLFVGEAEIRKMRFFGANWWVGLGFRHGPTFNSVGIDPGNGG